MHENASLRNRLRIWLRARFSPRSMGRGERMAIIIGAAIMYFGLKYLGLVGTLVVLVLAAVLL